MIVSFPPKAQKIRHVHGEHVRFQCQLCNGSAVLAAVNGGLADEDGCWFCDDCQTGGRYDLVSSGTTAVRYRLRLAGEVHGNDAVPAQQRAA